METHYYVGVLVLAWLLTATNTQSDLFVQGAIRLIVDGSEESSIQTRIGCREVLRCSGNGTELIWRRFGLRNPLMSESNRMINTVSTPIDMEGVVFFQSELIINPVTRRDVGAFTCSIDNITLTATLFVELSVAAINASDFDLTDFFIGSELAILCPVDTCIPDVTVKLIKESNIIDSVIVSDASVETPQFNPKVTENLVGEFICSVMVNFNGTGSSFQQPFNITGMPRPAPTSPGGGASMLHATITLLPTMVIIFLSALL